MKKGRANLLVRNPDGLWINTKYFTKAADFFNKHGYYTPFPVNTPEWLDYWQEERLKSIKGLEVAGAKIPGDYYSYLNFSPIMKSENDENNSARKIQGFPDFRDGDYEYFWAREIARNGVFSAVSQKKANRIRALKETNELEYYKQLKEIYDSLKLRIQPENLQQIEGNKYDLVVGKARRKGYSYKAAHIAAKNWALRPYSKTLLVAYNMGYLTGADGLYTKTRNNISFFREYTAWNHPSDVLDSNSNGVIRASYKELIGGRKVEKGFMSAVISLSYAQKVDITRGYDAYDVFFEESGAAGSPGRLKSVLAPTRATVKAGAFKTGLITVFGTSGELEKGAADYRDLVLSPGKYQFMQFKNIWDGGEEYDNPVGFFHPENWNMEGYQDKNGNSDVEGAKKHELAIRKEMLASGATSVDMQQRKVENPLSPLEAFGSAGGSIFPVVELRRQLRKIESNNLWKLRATPVNMFYKDGKLNVEPILDDSCSPITSYKRLPTNKEGCPVIYEFPIDGAPKNSYKIGYDPVAQDEGTSLGAIIVYKSVIRGSYTHDVVVAEYIGRPKMAQDIDRIAEMFADLYNSQIMHENMDKGTRTYFRRIRRLNLLASQPDAVINNSVKNSKVARVYGCHMNKELKAAGERYIQEWLLSIIDYDENGNPIRAYDRLYSTRLLEELINYNKHGNYDAVMALMMALFMKQEEVLQVENRPIKNNTRFEELDDLLSDTNYEFVT